MVRRRIAQARTVDRKRLVPSRSLQASGPSLVSYRVSSFKISLTHVSFSVTGSEEMSEDAEAVELDKMAATAKKDWSKVSHQIVFG